MSFLIAVTDDMAAAASDLANIGSMIGSANTSAAAMTVGVLPPAADEVSAQIAALFSTHAAGYQQLSAQAAAFHQQFVDTLIGGAGTYAAAEASVVPTLASAVPALGVDLNGGLSGLEASLMADISQLSVGLNAAVSGSFGGSLSGLAPLGAFLSTEVNGGLATLTQTGATLSTSMTAGLNGLTGLTGTLAAGMPGLATALPAMTGGLSGDIAAVANFLGLNAGLGADVVGGLTAMGAQATAYLTTGLGASLSGAPALLSSLAAPWHTLLTAASPTAFLTQLQTMETAFNSSLLNAELGFNAALVAQEQGFELALFGNLGNGVLNSVYNFWNSLLGTGEAGVNTLLGAPFAATGPGGLFPGLMVGPPGDLIGGGALGGLMFALDDKLLFDLNVVGAAVNALTGNGALQAALTAAMSGAGFQATLSGLLNGSLTGGLTPIGTALVAGPVAALQQLGTAQLQFVSNLGAMETAFDAHLLTSEEAWETSTFGVDNAFNGALDRLFNVANLSVLTGQQSVNSLLGGASTPALDAARFLTGSSTQVFDGSHALGGVEGIFDQSLAAGFDVAGML
ncbi:MAG: PE family protein [Mycobacterium sp.]|nr:PE family protein [Mycobacterium sp.]